MAAETWDVRELLNQARADRAAEDNWVAEHAGALAASQIGGCLRREKFRLMGAPSSYEPSAQMLRRWRWGVIYQDEVYRQALNAGRRPRKGVPLEVEIGGVVIRGIPDLVFTEGVLEIKTTGTWQMSAEFLPFSHQVQLGTYQFALQRPGQLLYGSFMEEWSFDFPQLPEVWEPWVQEVARLFTEHPGDDPLPFPPLRQYCTTCPYQAVCPQEATTPAEAPVSDLERQIVERYLAIHERASAAEKAEEQAKAALLGIREQRTVEDPTAGLALRLPGRTVLIKQSTSYRTDYTVLDPAIRESLPKKPVVSTRITTIESED